MHAGRVYLFLGSAAGLGTTPAWWVEGGSQCNATYCNVGAGMAGAGDVNGDGYDDVIVGAARWNGGLYDEGRVFVYYGSSTGLGTTANWSAEGNQYMAYYGWAVSTAGDINGDGYDDIIVGAGNFDHGQTNEGRTFMYLGSSTGLSCGAGCPVDATAAAAWTFESDQNYAGPGTAVGAAGDVNGDGFDDVIVGAYQFDDTLSDEGKAWVFHGSPTGLGAPAWSAVGGQAGARFGSDAYTAGDVNADGYNDVIVGAYRHDNGQTDEGRAYVYLGSATGLASAPAWTTESTRRAPITATEPAQPAISTATVTPMSSSPRLGSTTGRPTRERPGCTWVRPAASMVRLPGAPRAIGPVPVWGGMALQLAPQVT